MRSVTTCALLESSYKTIPEAVNLEHPCSGNRMNAGGLAKGCAGGTWLSEAGAWDRGCKFRGRKGEIRDLLENTAAPTGWESLAE